MWDRFAVGSLLGIGTIHRLYQGKSKINVNSDKKLTVVRRAAELSENMGYKLQVDLSDRTMW